MVERIQGNWLSVIISIKCFLLRQSEFDSKETIENTYFSVMWCEWKIISSIENWAKKKKRNICTALWQLMIMAIEYFPFWIIESTNRKSKHMRNPNERMIFTSLRVCVCFFYVHHCHVAKVQNRMKENSIAIKIHVWFSQLICVSEHIRSHKTVIIHAKKSMDTEHATIDEVVNWNVT